MIAERRTSGKDAALEALIALRIGLPVAGAATMLDGAIGNDGPALT
jgi:hypothetical protein